MSEPHYKEYIRQILLSRKRIRLGYCDVMKDKDVIIKYVHIHRKPLVGVNTNGAFIRWSPVERQTNTYHGHCRDDV